MLGKTLGHYQVVDKLGAGGMGEVYRARDTRLGRDVAIKVLPPAFAQDRERLARFEREAQVLAALNHPNIAAIHGLEETDGLRYLVLELAPGENLRGPLPVEDAVAIAGQIIDALEEAHEKGIVHRDLKPPNIKVTPEGQVKVLDFGLAKALAGELPGEVSTNSPTLTLAAFTQGGVLLGTAAYMSPEQARGKPVDKRSDIWAFGCVLYEMLTGKQVFGGQTVTDSLAAIVHQEPDWSALPASTPWAVRRLLARCLEKDAKRRLRDIGDARMVLESSEPQITTKTPSHQERPWFSWVSWCLGGGIAVFAAAISLVHFREKPPEVATSRFLVLPPEKATGVEYPAISPDGRRLAFVATIDGKNQLWVRPLDSLSAHPLAGTEEAAYPFWSPDSRFVGFFAQNKLKKVDVSGAPPQTLCDAPGSGRGGAWNRDGVIVFGSGTRDPLRRVSSAGGASNAITALDPTELSHRWPHFLPDGRHFLYFNMTAERAKRGVFVATLGAKPQSKDHKRLLAGASLAAYSETSGVGRLLFEREGILLAQPFDLEKLEVGGEPLPVAPQVGIANQAGWAAFSASSTGTLVYQAGSGARTQLAWFDRAGKSLGAVGSPGEWSNFRLAPDEKRIAAERREQDNIDIWVHELARNTPSRFTFHPGSDGFPVWSPDGTRIVFGSARDGQYDLYLKASSGASEEELLLKSDEIKTATDWSPDGRYILYRSVAAQTGFDLWVLPLAGDRKPVPFLQTEFTELFGRFSPDGKWIAYASNASGRLEVYVRGFPKSGGQWQVSNSGASRPRWRRDGKELFYLTADRKLMGVDVKTTGATFEAGQPRELFQTSAASVFLFVDVYDVTADGKRFLINSALEEAAAPPITVVENWAAGVKK